MSKTPRTWIIFHCTDDCVIVDKDDCWVVAKLEGDLALGVADCPDEKTARAMLTAMQDRDTKKNKAPKRDRAPKEAADTQTFARRPGKPWIRPPFGGVRSR